LSFGYKVLDLQSQASFEARAVNVLDGKFLLQIQGLYREKELCHASFVKPEPSRLVDFRDSPRGHRELRSTEDLVHAEVFQFQELRLTTTVTNTLDNEAEPQGFAKASKSEAWMDSMRQNSQV
jgi:hypothetical protein